MVALIPHPSSLIPRPSSLCLLPSPERRCFPRTLRAGNTLPCAASPDFSLILTRPPTPPHFSRASGRALPRRDADAPDALLLADDRAGLTGPWLARSGDGQLTAAFDGTIYNRAALRAELAAAGQSAPLSDRDDDLLLALYAQSGAPCVKRLRGPFALAVWDGRNGTGLLARDPLGFALAPLFP